MRLINAETLVFQDYANNPPVYAILSHTWGSEEVTLEEMKAHKNQPDVKRKSGFTKIKKACEQARHDGFEYIWIDTCCIDKTSSSELSEAINSMYKWYQEAEVCYAYLADVTANENAFDKHSQFRKCRWFTRGWTLQELIAPLSLVFYDKDWVEIGTKSSMRTVITEITKISKQVLLVNHSGEISIAARMSWAANRQTTRIEDMAYCLLGLFGINMPILYGEGDKAFTRLQREIITTSDDHTIFAWVGGDGGSGAAGLLAKSPAEFAHSSWLSHKKVDQNRSPYNITNVGLSIKLPLQRVSEQGNQFKAILNCTSDSNSASLCGIYLNKDKEGQYVRTRTTEIFTESSANQQRYRPQAIYIKEPVPSRFDVMQWMRPRTNYQFIVKKLSSVQTAGFTATQFYPNSGDRANDWKHDAGNLHSLTLAGSGISGGILFESHGQSDPYERFVVMLGMHNYNVWCDIVNNIPASHTLETVAKSYYYDGGGDMLWENRDRLCKQLTLHDKYVFVAARKGITGSSYQYTVDITITTGAPPNSSAGGDAGLDMWMPQAAYRFHVIFDLATWEVVELTVFDSVDWHRRKDHSLTVSLKHSGISGIMVLRDRATEVRVAVLIGVHNYEPWSDVIPDIGSQAGVAKGIRDSYYSSEPGNRNSRLWDLDTDLTRRFSENRSVRVTTTEQGKDAFVTEIIVVNKG